MLVRIGRLLSAAQRLVEALAARSGAVLATRAGDRLIRR